MNGRREDDLEVACYGFRKRDELDEACPAIALELSTQVREDLRRVRTFPPFPEEGGRKLGTTVPANGESICLRQEGFDRLVSRFRRTDPEEIGGVKVEHPRASYGLQR